MEKFIALFLFFTINAHSQWDYTINSSKRISKAIGQISERKFKPSNSIIENESYRIFEMKDLVSSEKYEVEDFLKILKSGKSLTLTVRLNDRVIQGFNDLNESFSPINSVIGDKF